MKVRVGVDASIEVAVLEVFSHEVELLRIPEEPVEDIAIDFWVAAMPPRILRQQWSHLKGVKVIQIPWAGVDTILSLGFPSNVTLCDARGVHDIPTAEWAVTAILAVQKCVPFFMRMQQQGKWAAGQQANQSDAAPTKTSGTKIKNPPAPIRDLAGSTVLIVGYGAIGQTLEARLAPFQVKFLRVARTAKEGVSAIDELDSLLPAADIVVLTLPLTTKTRKLMNAARIAKMKPGALLVNAARGPIVDTDALLAALQEKRIRAALDVTEPEPLPEGHPLWQAPNLYLTPHVAGDSDHFFQRAFQLASEQASRFARGEPLLNVVKGEY
jgi:phosphoglycerate dehydrogenase-like enzyme